MYLILYFPLAAILSANAAIVTLAMWMVGQSAIYQYESGRIMWALTIILQKIVPASGGGRGRGCPWHVGDFQTKNQTTRHGLMRVAMRATFGRR